MSEGRRSFLRWIGLGGATAAAASAQQATGPGIGTGRFHFLPHYARAGSYRSLKQSSFQRNGGNADRYQIAPGATQEVFRANGPGMITHMWFTIAAPQSIHT